MSKFYFRTAKCKCCQELVHKDTEGMEDVVAQIFDPDFWEEWFNKNMKQKRPPRKELNDKP